MKAENDIVVDEDVTSCFELYICGEKVVWIQNKQKQGLIHVSVIKNNKYGVVNAVCKLKNKNQE